MPYIKIIIILLCLCFFSCKKNEPFDIPVRGNVRNNCTGKGFANRLVQLSYNKQLFERHTDQNGDFDFGFITVRPKDNTKFKLGVPGSSNEEFELYGLTVILTQDEIAEFNQFGISVSFNKLKLIYPAMSNSNDTLFFLATQRALKASEPNRISEIELKIYNNHEIYELGINKYPMGWWHVSVNKFKNGIYSTVNDSVFMDMGATETYTIPW